MPITTLITSEGSTGCGGDGAGACGGRTLRAGARIFTAGDLANKVYIVTEGAVATSASNSNGKLVSRQTSRGELIGEDALLDGVYTYDAVAASDVSLRVFDAETVKRLGGEVLRACALRAHANWASRVAAQEGNLKIRLAQEIKRLTETREAEKVDSDTVKIAKKPKHKDLAALIGSDISSVSSYLKEMRGTGAVSYIDGKGSALTINIPKLDDFIAFRGSDKRSENSRGTLAEIP